MEYACDFDVISDNYVTFRLVVHDRTMCQSGHDTKAGKMGYALFTVYFCHSRFGPDEAVCGALVATTILQTSPQRRHEVFLSYR